ncbi:MAG: 23S rRNA (adenine(2503)-C(2))-methyltransferase RlmN [Candidatus Dojkabacteria bacterium]|nr:23S rRNA (adenine(2503)-C(2))-methyltransferase RlmN [Candidatus Dojkabacteria bacterium]MDQ7020418.1 23S rRNA (adenine(2503)-C(2))-methyltransferase RlmN [Candidatus Dojkabacteria bacterium]
MIKEFVEKNKLPKFRENQFNQAIYKDIAFSFDDITTWSKDLREKIKEEVEFFTLEEARVIVSKREDTIKALFKRKKDGKLIETVLMRHRDGRNTVCVSCMVGCPVNCRFCATGKMGFNGNLDAREIVDQVLWASRYLKKLDLEDQKVTNIVFMGMGEPMLNLKSVLESIDVFTDEDKYGMSTRRITISTSGFIPQMNQLFESGFRGRLAISLHAPNQKLRAELMPVAEKFELDELMRTLDNYVELTNKRVSYEYIMIKDKTDTAESARELVDLMKNRLHHVNLIPFNPVRGEDYKRSPKENIKRFTGILEDNGINFTIRVTMGDDVDAACGQLVTKVLKRERRTRD